MYFIKIMLVVLSLSREELPDFNSICTFHCSIHYLLSYNLLNFHLNFFAALMNLSMDLFIFCFVFCSFHIHLVSCSIFLFFSFFICNPFISSIIFFLSESGFHHNSFHTCYFFIHTNYYDSF